MRATVPAKIYGGDLPQLRALSAQVKAAFAKTRDMVEVPDTQAQDAYHDLHQSLSDELPYLYLWKLDTKSAWRTEIRGNIIAPYYYFTEFDSWKYGK